MKALPLVSAISFPVFSMYTLVRLIIPLLLVSIQAPLVYVGIIMAAHSATISVLAVPFGLVSDRLGRKRMASLSLALMLIALVSLTASNDLYGIILSFVLLGVSWAGFEPTFTALVGDISTPGNMGRSYGVYAATAQAAFSFGPAVGGGLVTLYGFNTAFGVSALTTLVALVILLAALRVEEVQNLSSKTRGDVKETFVSLSKRRNVLAGWVASAASFALIGGFEAFFPVYANNLGLEAWLIGLLFSAQFVVGLIVRIPFGSLLDRRGKKIPIMALGMAGNALTVALIAFSTEPITLLLLMTAMSASRAATNIGALTLVAMDSAVNERGFAQGLTATFRNIGSSMGPSIFALSAATMGFGVGFIGLSLLAIPACAILLRLTK
ncbi:MAG: MFS transporter [Thaumarchaeota archaeon]|nr:MFS transporter [Nitrososphaerota archaeon]